MNKHQAMRVMAWQPLWQAWMYSWVYFDEKDQAYVGTCPDEDELCRDSDAGRFLVQWGEASEEWGRQQEEQG